MSSSPTRIPAEGDGARAPVRRHLSECQADTVAKLADAAVDEVRVGGYDGLTVRNVARRAGVAPATAYTYFASKDHLVAEVFWRRLQTGRPAGPTAEEPIEARVREAIRAISDLVSGEPELAAACTTALLASDPDVARLRGLIGLELNDRLSDALVDGSDALDGSDDGDLAGGAAAREVDPAVLDALSLALSGAMLQAGMGFFPHHELADRMAGVVRLVLGGRS
jgi:AcrR family transcriptional regulator